MPAVNPIIRAVTVKDPQVYVVSIKGNDSEFSSAIATELNVITLAFRTCTDFATSRRRGVRALFEHRQTIG